MTRGADLSLFVPGRIEFLGKHTDYAGGRSLVCAIERGISFAAHPRNDRTLNVRDTRSDEQMSVEIGPGLEIPKGTWQAYPLTTVRRLARNFPRLTRGADITISSDLPQAAGLSSSSALITGCFIILARFNELELTAEYRAIATPEREAEYASCIENGRDFAGLSGDTGVGTLGGSQDHAAILLSEPNRLVQVAFAPLRREASLPLPPDHLFAVATSGVMAQKTGPAQAGFNRIARIAGRILDVARDLTGGASLFEGVQRDSEMEDRIRRRLSTWAGGEFDPGELLGRFEQMMLEATVLVPDAAYALRTGDLAALRHTVDLSQMLAERLLGNQVPETMTLVREARACGALATSSFGAGFGGSVWALVEEAGSAEFLEEWRSGYQRAFPARSAASQFFLTRAGPPLTIQPAARPAP